MPYRVIWHRAALRELARLCSQKGIRARVARAANFAERLLMIDPANEGSPIPRGRRRVHVTPLLIDFEVDERDQTVTIFHVQYV